MIDPTEDADTTPARPNGRRSGLEDRVRKLEAAVVELKEATPTEEAVADRVKDLSTCVKPEEKELAKEAAAFLKQLWP